MFKGFAHLPTPALDVNISARMVIDITSSFIFA